MSNTNRWQTFPRWLMEEQNLISTFNAQLASGQAGQVTARIQREPHAMETLLALLGDARTPLSTRIGIGVVMEDFTGTTLLRQYIPALGKLCRHSDARIRADACHYLGLSQDRDAAFWLKPCLLDTATEVRETAIDALKDLADS